MGKCLNLTKSGEYAISSLARLALETQDNPSRHIAVELLADYQKIPKSFLLKILAQCAKAGFLRSRVGVGGGVALAKPAKEISLLEIIETCEGRYSRDRCLFYSDRLCEGPQCPVYCPLRREEEGLRKKLKNTSLFDMASALKNHPNAGKGS